MATLKKYDFTGKETGEEIIDDAFLIKEANGQLVKDYIVALRKNARQWSANTKGRSEVSKAMQKAQQQKGLGRARHGFLGAPQFKGGGVVFGPKPKFDQHVKINKKEKRLAIRMLLSEKILNGKVCVLGEEKVEKPKTKLAFEFFKALQMDNSKVLIVGNAEADCFNFLKSIRNIPKKNHTFVSKINGYEIINAQNLVIMSTALDGLKEILAKNVGSINE